MYDPIPVHILSLFLLITVVALGRGLMRRWRGVDGRAITPAGFLISVCTIVPLTLLFAAAFGVPYILLALGLSAGIVGSLIDPVFGVSFFVATLLLRPWEVFPQNGLMTAMPRILAAIALIAWLMHRLRQNNGAIVWNRTATLCALFVAWLFLAASFATVGDDSIPTWFSSFYPIIVLCLLVMNSLRSMEDLTIFRSALVISISGVIACALYMTIGTDDGLGSRLHGPGLWQNANDLAALIVMVLPLVLLPLLRRERSSRLDVLLLATILFAGLCLSQSRGAFLAMCVSILTYILFCSASPLRRLATITVLLLLLLLAPLALHRELNDLEGSSSSRWHYLIAGLRMAKAHPLFGVGMNNYPREYEHFTPAFTEWGERTAHSSWVLVLAESGWLGLLLFVAIFARTIKSAWRVRRTSPEYLSALTGYGTAMSFLSHTYLFIPYLLIALVLSVERIQRRMVYFAAVGLLFALPVLNGESAQAEAQALRVSVGLDKPFPGYLPPALDALQLSGSRGETLTFMLTPSQDSCLTFPADLANSDSSIHLKFYSMPRLQITRPSFSGALPGSYLDPLVPVSRSACTSARGGEWFLGEIEIPRQARPGRREGTLSFGEHLKLPYSLKVWHMLIPERPALPAYAELTSWYTVLGHFGAWNDQEAALARAYSAEMMAHRIYPVKNAITRPVIKNDLRELDLKNSPSSTSSFYSLVLKERPAWTYFDLPTTAYSNISAGDASTYFSAVQNTIVAEHLQPRAFTYLWDEPKDTDMPRLIELARTVRQRAPALKIMVTTSYRPILRDLVDIFVPVMDYFDKVPRSEYEDLRKHGHEVWWYVSCMSHGCEGEEDSGVPDFVIDRPASSIRSIPWISAQYPIDAFLYYSVNNGYRESPRRDPWRDLWDFTGNGDGTLFYPGKPGLYGLTAHVPITSLRLKTWREASFDAEYIRWMKSRKEKPDWWTSGFQSIARSTTDWDRSYAHYRELRDRAGDFLDATKETL